MKINCQQTSVSLGNSESYNFGFRENFMNLFCSHIEFWSFVVCKNMFRDQPSPFFHCYTKSKRNGFPALVINLQVTRHVCVLIRNTISVILDLIFIQCLQKGIELQSYMTCNITEITEERHSQ
ncbi:hypothetical protein ACKWTF_008738 [Chironomus riparius]